MANRSDRGGIEPITSVAYPGPVSAIGSPPAHSILATSFKPPLEGRRYDCSQTSRRHPALSTREWRYTV